MISDAVGPRGGRVRVEVSCYTCTAVLICRPGECSKRWGCGSWTDDAGNRAVIPTIEPDPAPVVAGQGTLFEEG